MTLHVSFKLVLILKHGVAHRAREAHRVGRNVQFEVRVLREPLLARRALRVDRHVRLAAALADGHAANLAQERRLLDRVASRDVRREGGRVAELLEAAIALVGEVALVDGQVDVEALARAEALRAQRAPERLFGLVEATMVEKGLRCGEPLVTLHTIKQGKEPLALRHDGNA